MYVRGITILPREDSVMGKGLKKLIKVQCPLRDMATAWELNYIFKRWFKNPSAHDLQGCTRKFQIETAPPGSLPSFFIEYKWGPRKTPPGEIWAILNRRKYLKKSKQCLRKTSPETEMPDFRLSWFFKFNVLTKLRNEENCCETRTLMLRNEDLGAKRGNWLRNEDFFVAKRGLCCETRTF